MSSSTLGRFATGVVRRTLSQQANQSFGKAVRDFGTFTPVNNITNLTSRTTPLLQLAWAEVRQIIKSQTAHHPHHFQAPNRIARHGISRGFCAPSSSGSGIKTQGTAGPVGQAPVAEGAVGKTMSSHWEKAKEMFRKYGYVFVGTYFSVWVSTFSGFYLLISNQMMKVDQFDEENTPNPLNPMEVFHRVTSFIEDTFGIDFHLGKVEGNASSFFIAYVATKITEPLRFIVAAVLTPRVARLVGRVPK